MRAPKTFEEGLQRLQELLAKMQDETTTLDQSVKLYAEAAQLIQYCNTALDKAKLQIEEIDASLAQPARMSEPCRIRRLFPMEQERYQQQYKAFVQQGGAAPERTVRCLSAGKSPNQPGQRVTACWAGGKRVRAVLVLAACQLAGGDTAAAADYAAALEMLHCYSLIHDDMPCMDNDDYRRGRLSCHKQYGEATALLAADALVTAAFEAVANAPTHPQSRVQAAAHLAKAAGHAVCCMARNWISITKPCTPAKASCWNCMPTRPAH